MSDGRVCVTRVSEAGGQVMQVMQVRPLASTRNSGDALDLRCVVARAHDRIPGARALCLPDRERAYRTQLDPRRNNEQSLEIAMAIVRKRQQGPDAS